MRFRIFEVVSWLKKEDEDPIVTVKPMFGGDEIVRQNVNNFHKLQDIR